MELNGPIPEWAEQGDGDGDGSGYGSDGSGYGSGYGSDDGFGSGDGSGSGFGYGFGSGFGYGSGDGSGFGYGYEGYDGSGYGSGSGYGYLYQIARTIVGSLKIESSVLAFWRSDSQGRPANGGSGDPVTIGQRQKCRGPLSICQRGFHATMRPSKWKGERLWIVALYGEFQHEKDKFCALEREIVAEITT